MRRLSLLLVTVLLAGGLLIPLTMRTARAAAPASIDVTVPTYVVNKVGGYDHVTIPGGLVFMLEEGRPRVPYLVKTFDYPSGTVVQDVVMESRSGLTTMTGLRLPIVILDDVRTQDPAPVMGIWPRQAFSWHFTRNNDGTGTLVLSVFPFYYDPASTGVQFYQSYRFSVSHTTSTVTIVEMSMEQDSYQQGETVRANVRLRNSGAAQDVFVAAAVRARGSGEALGGAPVRLLREVSGDASVSVEWPSGNARAGSYVMEVRLTSTQSNVLDRASRDFGLFSGAVEFYIGKTYYTVGGVRFNMDVAPYIKSSRTFLPVRFVAYGCGVTDDNIIWDPVLRTVQLRKGGTTLLLQIGSPVLKVTTASGATTVQMDVAPEITSSRTMLPVRWVAENLGYSVGWDGATRTVRLTR
jgi:hypothetical protein